MSDINTFKNPSICDGIEQDAFEAWAVNQKYSMDTHPLHWLFLNEKTDAARQGWKAGLVHATNRMEDKYAQVVLREIIHTTLDNNLPKTLGNAVVNMLTDKIVVAMSEYKD